MGQGPIAKPGFRARRCYGNVLRHTALASFNEAVIGGTSRVSSIVPHIARIRRLFPERAEEVARLALRNDAFRAICEDYGMALEALNGLEIRNHPLDLEKILEYRALIRDLERELREELARSPFSTDLKARNEGKPA